MPWSCRVNAELGDLFFCGEDGRIKAKVWRGKITREMENGLLALKHARAISYLRRDWDVQLLDTGRLLLSGGGWHAEIQPLRGASIPRSLVEALVDVFVKKRPQGSRNEERRAAARIGGKKSGETRRAKREAGPREKKPRRERRSRGRMSLEERQQRRAARKATQRTTAAPAAQGE